LHGESISIKMLVPVDVFPCSKEAFRVALTLAGMFQAKLWLLHAIETSALAAFNLLGLLALEVLSNAQGQIGCPGSVLPLTPISKR
jgi:nucleotide-binding universal stress UspA family protein